MIVIHIVQKKSFLIVQFKISVIRHVLCVINKKVKEYFKKGECSKLINESWESRNRKYLKNKRNLIKSKISEMIEYKVKFDKCFKSLITHQNKFTAAEWCLDEFNQEILVKVTFNATSKKLNKRLKEFNSLI